MDKNPLIRKGLAVGIVLLLGVIAVVPGINATVCKTSPNSLVEFIEDSNQLYTRNETRHMFCFIESGDVQLRNFQGRFYSIPIATNSDIRHFGIGTFQLDLVGWNENSSQRSLSVTLFDYRYAEYFHDVKIYVKTFVGWYQPTDDLSIGGLSGFTLSIKINPLWK
jgi:hypothetical protein